MIEIGAIPRASTFAAAAPWNTSRSQCEIPSEPNVLDQRQQAVDAVTPLSFFSRRRQIVSGNQLSGPAISGAIDQSTSHGRHQHPDRSSLERCFEPASPLRPDHRHGSIPIGRDPRSAASFNQASVQSRVPVLPCPLCPDAGSRRTLNHFQPKVITDSGDHDHAVTRRTEPA